MSDELSLIPSEPTGEMNDTLATLGAPLIGYLAHIGLPSESLLSPVDERRTVIEGLPRIVNRLSVYDRSQATYLSKLTVCVANGLFDGALTYLWDESVRALRNHVEEYDLHYFFEVMRTVSGRYRSLSDASDLPAIGDHDLLEGCRRIGLIDDVNFERLRNANYFRNHASAAHPTEHEISGAELLAHLDNCVRFAIHAKPDKIAISIHQLLLNLREQEFEEDDASAISEKLCEMPSARVDTLLQTVFGIYCDPDSPNPVLRNIDWIGEAVWNNSSTEMRNRIGARYGRYRVNGDVQRRAKADEFFDLVGGHAYKDEDSIAASLLDLAGDLRTAHFGENNFYNERGPARELRDKLPDSGIPDAARKEVVKSVSLSFCGNGRGYYEGVDTAAIPYLNEIISSFGSDEMKEFVLLFTDPEFRVEVSTGVPRRRAKTLAETLTKSTKNRKLRDALGIICKFKGDFRSLKNAADYKKAVASL